MKQFKDFINEARTLPEFETIRANFTMVVLDGLYMVISGQLAHWSTSIYATHEALGEFYEALKDNLDQLVEAGIAVGYDTSQLRDFNLNIQGNDLETFESNLMSYRASVSETINICPPTMSTIEGHLASILKTIDTMSYKLSLS